MLLFLCCFFLPNLWAQEKTVTGTVVDEQEIPMIGVSVTVKGTTIGSITDLDGNFSLKVNDPNATLLFSYVGYVPIEMKIGDKTRFDIVMKEDSEMLEEVVVIGFQSQKKENLTAAVARVGSDVLENRPVSNIGQALKGVMPGVNISIGSGAPNAIPNLNIRGATTIRLKSGGDASKSEDFQVSSGSPLVLIDGVEVSATQLNQMNPNDVDNISFLKDASAAAIYGTRATFGVIIVTTKSGNFEQKPKVNYSYSIGWDTPAAVPDILDSYSIEEIGLLKKQWNSRIERTDAEQMKLDNLKKYQNNPSFANSYYMQGGSIVWVGNMNPFDVALKDWTTNQKHNLSVSGGGKNVSYFISLGLMDQDGMYKLREDNFKRYNASASINAKVTNWFNLKTKVTLNQNKYNTPHIGTGQKGSLWSSMVNGSDVRQNINMPLLTGSQAEIDKINEGIPEEDQLGIPANTPTDNVLSLFQNSGAYDRDKRTTAIYSISPEFIIIPKELKVNIDFAYTTSIYEKTEVRPKFTRLDNTWTSLIDTHMPQNDGNEYRYNDSRYTLNTYVDYNKQIGDHNFSALAGFNQEMYTRTQLIGSYRNLINANILDPSAVYDQTLNSIGNSWARTTSRAIFGRLMYNYKSRYLVEFDLRYDGSSKFPKSERFQTFPTFSAGWRLTEEKFMEFSRKYLDNVKLRYSWGVLGSQPGDYEYIGTMNTGQAHYLFEGGRYPNTITTGKLVNPFLTWEKAKTVNYGIDVTALKNRFDLTFEYYERKTSDILLPSTRNFPAVLGAVAPWENTGVLKVKGWEFMVNWRDKLSNGLGYSVGFNLFDSKTTVESYAPNTDLRIDRLYTGQTMGDIWGYETGGILQESDFNGFENNIWQWEGTDHSQIWTNLAPGYVWLQDLDGNGVISTSEETLLNPKDKKVIGNNLPRYTYSINLGVDYKGFDLSLNFQGTGKRDYWLNHSTYWGGGMGTRYMYDRSWTPERTNAKFPQYNTGGGTNGRAHSGFLIDASYFKLQQALLGYTVPIKLTKKIGVEKVRMTLAGYNIFTISDIPSHYDPEQLSIDYPQKRTIEFGVQVEF